MEKRVELLAPCGSYESFLAALNAGADAVYLGGRQFGARAYAENFSQEELVCAIQRAHLYGVKVYLTVNTLVKEREFSGLYRYLLPFYEAGLDGVIVQDMGVFCSLRRQFPDLKLHASTQMTITGAYGAACLKELGCERIVPARELSLREIKEIKRQVPVEIETFIHGAMCYCYSGQCLMSSMIGGRSGNRGRCAGPCRLPYRTAGREGYFLSLKDMNMLEYIPALIEAGIDSFKIEGRMKKPEYVAGVVSVYRKYIDRYYAGLSGEHFFIEPEDRKLLSELYIRSETGSGYYERRNGKGMLTLDQPGYLEANPELLAKLREKYVKEPPKMPVRFLAVCRENEPLYGEVRFQDRMCTDSEGGEIRLSVTGEPVERADKRALEAEEIREQLRKTGGTPFAVEECTVEAGEHVFLPVSRIKGLRRSLLQKIYEYYGARNGGEMEAARQGESGGTAAGALKCLARKSDLNGREQAAENENKDANAPGLTVMVQTREQFEEAFSALEGTKEYLIADADLYLEEEAIREKLSGGKVRWGIRCPVIIRKSDEAFLKKLRSVLEADAPEIVYCATIDMFAWLKNTSCRGKIAGEASLYAWNGEAAAFWGKELVRVSTPLELSSREIKELSGAARNVTLEAPVYGRAPFMVSANCVKLSAGGCDKNRKRYATLTDRYGNVFPVYTNCAHCYNMIYNCLPTSCLEDLWMLMEDGIRAFRIDFTTESGEEVRKVIQTFRRVLASEITGRAAGRADKKDRKKCADGAAKGDAGRTGTERKKEKVHGVETTKGRFRLGVE